MNPGAGRWDRPDPLGMIDGPNRYLYVLDAPTATGDPRGLFLPKLHEEITREAFSGVVASEDMESVIRGVIEADAYWNQSDDFRHGMRGKNTTLEAGAREWVNFFDSQLALAVVPVCGHRDFAMFQLGIGAHAVEDFYSPPHRMQVMNWAHPFDHRNAEKNLTINSGPAREAVTSAREYALLYRWLSRLPVSMDRTTVMNLAWGMFGYMRYIDAVAQP